MNFINDNKLTDYDRQVLTLLTMAPSAWQFDEFKMSHSELGDFRSSLRGFGMQRASYPSVHYRRLSWRGQIKLRQAYDRIMASAVDLSEARKAEKELPTTSALSQAQMAHNQRMAQLAKMAATQQTTALYQAGLTPPTKQATKLQESISGASLYGIPVQVYIDGGVPYGDILRYAHHLLPHGSDIAQRIAKIRDSM